MSMRLLVVMLRRNELQSQQLEIPAHELPVLAYVHGEENCVVTGIVTVEDREVPTAGEEFTRLTNKYGRDKANESMEARVAVVYGGGPNGMRQLAQAIEYGQRPGLGVEAFQLGLDHEPAHDAPKVAQPLQRTRPTALSHEQPAAMQPGVADGKRETTVKARRRAAQASK